MDATVLLCAVHVLVVVTLQTRNAQYFAPAIISVAVTKPDIIVDCMSLRYNGQHNVQQCRSFGEVIAILKYEL